MMMMTRRDKAGEKGEQKHLRKMESCNQKVVKI